MMENEFQEQYIPGLKNNQSRLFLPLSPYHYPKLKKNLPAAPFMLFTRHHFRDYYDNINIKKLCLFSSQIWGRKSKKNLKGGGRTKNLELYTPQGFGIGIIMQYLPNLECLSLKVQTELCYRFSALFPYLLVIWSQLKLWINYDRRIQEQLGLLRSTGELQFRLVSTLQNFKLF